MHRIDAPDATSDHRFTSGDPTIPVPATTVTAEWLNSVQEELAAAIAAAGISLDKTRNDQLKTALGILIEAGVGTVTPEGIGAVPVTRTVTAGTGLTGGGALNANRTLSVKLVNAVNSTDTTSAATANAVKVAYDKAVAALDRPPYELCEFYFFRHPTLRPGFQPAQGGLLANAATLYPEAWAYLQTTEGKKLCKSEAEWQAMTKATWATLTDGTKVGWDGIGGAPFYAPNTATGALRLPDLRGMYAEAAGFDALGVGGTHGDGIRNIQGAAGIGAYSQHSYPLAMDGSSGALQPSGFGQHSYAATSNTGMYGGLKIDASLVVPVTPVNRPRAWGALACVYLGTPR